MRWIKIVRLQAGPYREYPGAGSLTESDPFFRLAYYDDESDSWEWIKQRDGKIRDFTCRESAREAMIEMKLPRNGLIRKSQEQSTAADHGNTDPGDAPVEILFSIGEIGYIFYAVGDQGLEGATLLKGGRVRIKDMDAAADLIIALDAIPAEVKKNDGCPVPGNSTAAEKIRDAYRQSEPSDSTLFDQSGG